MKHFLFFLLVGIAGILGCNAEPYSSASQFRTEYEKQFDSFKDSVLVFELTNPQLDSLVKVSSYGTSVLDNSTITDNPSLLKKCIGTYEDRWVAIDSLKSGNYILAKFVNDRVNCEYLNKSELVCKAERAPYFSIKLFDLKGNCIKNAQVAINNDIIPFDDLTETYRSKRIKLKDNETRYVRITYNGVVSYYFYEQDIFKFNRMYAHQARKRSEAQNTYMVTDKPKYKPNDTVRVKAHFKNPLSKHEELSVYLKQSRYGSDKMTFVKKVKPNNKESVAFEFVLHDSLNLELDRGYIINLDGEISDCSFMYEDYELSGISLFVNSSDNFMKDDTLEVKVKATDENNLNLLDATVTVRLEYEDMKERFQPHYVLPMVLHEEKMPLNTKGETVFKIPASVMPKANIMYKLITEVQTSDRRTERKELQKEFFYHKKQILSSEREDSISFVYKLDGKETSVSAKIYGLDAFSNRTLVAETSLPCTLKIDPYYAQYRISIPGFTEQCKVNSTPVNVSLSQLQDGDSIDVRLHNPFRLPINYSLYRNDKLLEERLWQPSATDSSVRQYTIKRDGKSSYHLFAQYLWAGKLNDVSAASLVSSPNQITIVKEEPRTITPGQTCDIKLKVTDPNGKPVKNADLTAYSVTSKMKTFPPSFNHRRLEKRKKDYRPDISPMNYSSRGYLLYDGNSFPYWKEYLHLDTLLYARMHDAGDSVISCSFTTKDSTTQFAPLVFDLYSNYYYGDPHKYVNVVYCDGEPVYMSNLSDGAAPYSIHVEPGYHRIVLRTAYRCFEIDSVYFPACQKTVIALDYQIDTLKNKKVRWWNMPNKLTDGEYESIENYILTYHNLASIDDGPVFLKNGDNYYRLQVGSYNFLGPMSSSYVKLMTRNDSLDFSYDKKCVYSYDFKRRILLATSRNEASHLGRYLYSYDYYSSRLADECLTAEDVERYLNKSCTKYRFNLFWGNLIYGDEDIVWKNYNRKHHNAAYVIRMILYRKEDPTDLMVESSIANVKREGVYCAYCIWSDGCVEKADSLVFKANHITLVDSTAWTSVPDSLSKQLIAILKSGGDEANVRGESSSRLVCLFSKLEGIECPFVDLGELPVVSDDELGFEEFDEWYSSSKRYDVTGSLLSVDNALAGRVSGVQVATHSGQPGAESSIRIRGTSSLSGSKSESSEPLVVINGMPVKPGTNPLAGINPSEVLSMEVLKDASATAIYGCRASNGVILIQLNGGLGAFDLETENEEMEVPTGEGGLRTRFSDSGFWQPLLRTDKNGEATFTVTFPDDITNWNTFYIATKNGRTPLSGSANGSIKSFLPLAAKLSLPNFVVKGDSCNIMGKLHNYTSDTIRVQSQFIVNGQEKKTASHAVSTAVNDTFPLVVEADSMTITYMLETDAHFKDGEKRSVDVLSQGVTTCDGSFHVMSANQTLDLTFFDKSDSATITVMNSAKDVLTSEIERLKRYPFLCGEQATSKLVAYYVEEELAGKPLSKHDENEKLKLVDLLNERQLNDGTWGWWSGSSTSPWITKYVVDVMSEHDLLKNKTTLAEYFRRRMRSASDVSQKVDALIGLKRLGENLEYDFYKTELEKMKLVSFDDTLSLMEFKAMCGKGVDISLLKDYRKETMKGSVYYPAQGNSHRVDANDRMNTARIYRILKMDTLDHQDELLKMRNYFYEKRVSNGYWLNTYESAMILRTIAKDVKEDLAKPAKAEILGLTSGNKSIKNFPFEMKVSSSEKIQMTSTSPLYVSVTQNYTTTERKESDFVISTVFPDSLLEAGKEVLLNVYVEVRKSAEYVMIEVPIPASCSYSDKSQCRMSGEVHREYYKEKVNIFCDKLYPGKYKYEIKLIPRYTGSYVLNPAKVEEMYQPVFNANESLKRVEVK